MIRLSLAALAAPLLAAAQELATMTTAPPAVIHVVARRIAFDLVDRRGVPVADPGAAKVLVFEDGVPRVVLAVEPIESTQASGIAAARYAIVPVTGEPAVDGQAPRVLIALDPNVLSVSAWRESLDGLARSAEKLVALGAVDVVALTEPAQRLATALSAAGEVRDALASARGEIRPLNAFYGERLRLLRDAQERRGAFQPARVLEPTTGAGAVPGFDESPARAVERMSLVNAVRELARNEARLVAGAMARLDEIIATLPRPLVIVWVSGGDPLPGEFVRQLLPDSTPPGDVEEIVGAGQAEAAWSEIERRWRTWSRADIRVVAWSPSKTDDIDLGSTEVRRQLARTASPKLAVDPLAIFSSASTATGGVLVRTPADLDGLLTAVRGRFVVTFQSDDTRPGWHAMRLEPEDERWRAIHAPGLEAPALAPVAPPASPRWSLSPALPVVLQAEREAAEAPGREKVSLTAAIDLEPLRGRLQPDEPVLLNLRIFATPAGGRTRARDLDVRLPRLPAEGTLRYETVLVVPAGAGAFAVEVREPVTRAVGAAAVLGTSDESRVPDLPGSDVEPPPFTELSEVRIAEARFLAPVGPPPSEESIRVAWRGQPQRVLRVVGGKGSPLELGVAIDVSGSVTSERAAFLSGAAAAVGRLLAAGDRQFRVDFGEVPRLIGAATGPGGALFAAPASGLPERTALFAAVEFALEQFSGTADRAALIVFTDGCNTSGRDDWRSAAARARSRAVPVIAVVADAAGCIAVRSATPFRGTLSTDRQRPSGIEGNTEVVPAHGSRRALRLLAEESGGLVLKLRGKGSEALWSDVERVLDRLWVAVFEPGESGVTGSEVEVWSGDAQLLSPSS